MPKKMKNTGKADVHEDLKGFDISINPFGEMETNLSVDKLNNFLDKNVQDKKLQSQQDQQLPADQEE